MKWCYFDLESRVGIVDERRRWLVTIGLPFAVGRTWRYWWKNRPNARIPIAWPYISINRIRRTA